MKYKLLIVEDEPSMREIIKDYFTPKDFQVTEATNGIDALEILESERFDIVLLDIMMPKLDGFAVCKKIRKTDDVPIIFLTAKSGEEDKLYGYKLGADDYITKPFSLALLHVKIMALLKRSEGTVLDDSELVISGICIHLKNKTVSIGGKEIYMAPKVYDLFLYLVKNKDKTLTREQLLAKVWGPDFNGYDRVVDSHIKKLRAALSDKACFIRTMVKSGYRFTGEGKTNES